ncbi:MAG: hypothetical protein K2O52_00485 [Oscillospiraceae bacterium]|nr:hypothetical protein [Oscillospiraceae bacterium]
MTRKEIEKRCREEMQEHIPDKEALWQKIESGLPEKPNLQPQKPNIKLTSMRNVMKAVACFLIIIGGLRIWSNITNLKINKNDNSSYASDDNANDYADSNDNIPEQEEQNIIYYKDLAVPMNQDLKNSIDLSKLGVQDEYFNESDVLAKTELFVDVQVLNGFQDETTGAMQYILKIIDVYGGNLDEQELIVMTNSAYILEKNHEYVLPIYQDNSNWELSYACAPQIEKTQDNQIIFHNGWQSVMSETTDYESIMYDSYGKDDYFYDRMYLTGDTAIAILVQKWQNL